MNPCFLQENEAGVILCLKVQPRSAKNQLVGLHGDELKLKLTAPPVGGAANQCCCQFLARLFGVSSQSVELISGASSRHKRVLITGISLNQVRALIDQNIVQ